MIVLMASDGQTVIWAAGADNDYEGVTWFVHASTSEGRAHVISSS